MLVALVLGIAVGIVVRQQERHLGCWHAWTGLLNILKRHQVRDLVTNQDVYIDLLQLS